MITCVQTEKTYSLGVEDQLRDKWAFYNSKWRKLKPNYQDEKWFEDYKYRIALTTNMLKCWMFYLPGWSDWKNHDDFTVTFIMENVKEAGWSEQHLVEVLGDMATYVKMRQVIHGEEPWLSKKIHRLPGDFIICTRQLNPCQGCLTRNTQVSFTLLDEK